MNQKTGVFMAICAVLGTDKFTGPVKLESGQKEEVFKKLQQQFEAGEIEFAGEDRTPEKLKKYIPGLVNNWLRKDERLNGGGKYQPKNPGSRTGSGDETIKNMKLLLQNVDDPEAKRTIQEEIEKRKAELKPRQEINVDALPEHLRKYALVD